MQIIKLITLLIVLTFSYDINSVNTFNIYSYTICAEDVTKADNVKKVIKVSSEKELKSLTKLPLTNKQINNVIKYQATIEKVSKEYKVPPDLIVGTWYAESGFNMSKSPFGIKCYYKTKSKAYFKDDCGTKKCCFENYNNFEEAIEFYCVFIQNQRDYNEHFDYDKDRVNFKAIANSGYCTAKAKWIANANKGARYYNKIINIKNEQENQTSKKDS